MFLTGLNEFLTAQGSGFRYVKKKTTRCFQICCTSCYVHVVEKVLEITLCIRIVAVMIVSSLGLHTVVPVLLEKLRGCLNSFLQFLLKNHSRADKAMEILNFRVASVCRLWSNRGRCSPPLWIALVEIAILKRKKKRREKYEYWSYMTFEISLPKLKVSRYRDFYSWIWRDQIRSKGFSRNANQPKSFGN